MGQQQTPPIAMWNAFGLILPKAHVIVEMDSEQCIETLTKNRKIWQRNGWWKDNGGEVASDWLQ
jgi:ribonuclease HI